MNLLIPNLGLAHTHKYFAPNKVLYQSFLLFLGEGRGEMFFAWRTTTYQYHLFELLTLLLPNLKRQNQRLVVHDRLNLVIHASYQVTCADGLRTSADMHKISMQAVCASTVTVTRKHTDVFLEKTPPAFNSTQTLRRARSSRDQICSTMSSMKLKRKTSQPLKASNVCP